MNDKDEIIDLIANKLKNNEAQVNPELWNAISSKLTTNIVQTTATKSLFSSNIVVLSSVVLISTTSLFIYFNNYKSNLTSIVSPKIEVSTDKDIVTSEIQKDSLNNDTTIENNLLINSQKSYKKLKQTKFQTEDFSPIQMEEINVNLNNEFIKNEYNSNPVNENVIVENKTIIKEENNLASKNSQQELVSKINFSNLPNVFTPNNDGENDFFYLNLKNCSDFSISIIDVNNKVVFTSSDPNFKWDGKDLNNSLVQPGKYIYYFSGKDLQGISFTKYKNLEIKY
jgi:gliding motility-associated-like protein